MKIPLILKSILISLLVIFQPIIAAAQEKPRIQLALLLDTSNSMDGLIDQAKAQLWKIVNEMSMARYKGEIPDLEIALYEYGNDNLSGEEGFVRMVAELTTDLDKISEDLFALSTKGGEEFCGHVITKACHQLTWDKNKSNKNLKLIFIAGNEPFNQGSTKYTDACELAKKNDIIVSTIFCGNYEEGVSTFWKEGAKLTDGKYLNIDQNRKVVYIETPYDDKIIELNEKLNNTYIPYGYEGEKMQRRQRRQDINATSYSKANMVNRGITKGSSNYRNAHWDLIDAIDEGYVELDKLDKKDLPENMQKMNIKEQKAYIGKMKAERETIKNEIKKTEKNRRAFIEQKKKEEAKDDTNTLDEALLKAIHELAATKGYEFEKE